MKNKSIFYIVTLITFPGISLAAGNDGLTPSSPSFMQQCGQSLKKLTKFAVMTSAILSPEISGRSFTEPSSTVPNIIQTPFNGNLTCVGVNPIKPEVALCGKNFISFVNPNGPDEPDILKLDGEDYSGINYVEYNPQATQLLIYSCLNYPCNESLLSILDLSTKTIETSYKTNYQVVIPLLFDASGTKVVMRVFSSDAEPKRLEHPSKFEDITTTTLDLNSKNLIRRIHGRTYLISEPTMFNVIWDVPANKTSAFKSDGGGLLYLARFFKNNRFIMNGGKKITTWSLNDPSKTKRLNISSANNTIFGGNEEQFAYYCPAVPGIIYLQNDNDIRDAQFDPNQYATVDSYCPESKKFIFTTGEFMLASNAYAIYSLDPETADLKKLYNVSTSLSSYNFPTFSPDGCKFFCRYGTRSK